MAHAQKPDLVFQRNGRVHLYWRGCQFSRLLAAEVCASAIVMLDRPCSDTVHECWLPTPFASFPFTSSPVLRRVPSDSVSTLTDTGQNMQRREYDHVRPSVGPSQWNYVSRTESQAGHLFLCLAGGNVTNACSSSFTDFLCAS